MNEPHSLFGRLFGGAQQQPVSRMPVQQRGRVEADDVPHARTWMSWPTSRSIWGRQLDGVQQDIALIARTVARFEPVILCAPDEREGLPFEQAEFVGEAGAVETDGDGTVMATESSLVNRNRNCGMSRDEVERAVLEAYGAERMIWVPGIKGRDITDDHIDVTSRFVRPGVVMVQVPPADRHDVWARDAREQFDLLSRVTDARGRRLQVIRVEGPDQVRSRKSTFVDSYLNFHLVNGAVITAQFGDVVKDEGARQTLAAAFPGREVVQLDVDRLMAGGGGIHCSTMQQPRA
ncbi:agmatine deiminase family protein [Streptacidiphilus fuscans]|uniref:Agmatine deiminase family protein n=1 Tax=Streptacidiphilus fuscans TaxID=2789292 RepID=A0A931FHK2_9ACTN|nr:agmatine deiminase family protein [Streptacidiphilus fuscans]MBF9071916.1 agmatine deiminase family protein [Streptacidiphilus fuscans]